MPTFTSVSAEALEVEAGSLSIRKAALDAVAFVISHPNLRGSPFFSWDGALWFSQLWSSCSGNLASSFVWLQLIVWAVYCKWKTICRSNLRIKMMLSMIIFYFTKGFSFTSACHLWLFESFFNLIQSHGLRCSGLLLFKTRLHYV